jgi:FeS assembly protein IscX
MKWVDISEIAIGLVDAYPDIDPTLVRFTQLRAMVLALPGFSDDAQHCGEKVLEAIQGAWIAESD